MAFHPLTILRASKDDDKSAPAPLAGTRRERIQRLQVGLFGLGSMVLLVGLANIIMVSAQQNQTSVPDEVPAGPTQDVPPPAPRDPLAEAGVVPDLAGPEPTTSAMPAPAAQETGNTALPARD